MKNIRYKVDRDNVHVGTIVKAKYVDTIDPDAARILDLPENYLVAREWKHVRTSALFVPDENMRMNDLLNDSPAYKIVNITPELQNPDEAKKKEYNEIMVNYPYNISELLAYLGYAKELTYGDILKIREVIFGPYFYAQFCELFGYREACSSEVQFLVGDKLVEDPKELEKRMREFDRRREMGDRGFAGVYESPLDYHYFELLQKHSDKKRTKYVLGNFCITQTRDTFAPNTKEEKDVKKLSLVS